MSDRARDALALAALLAITTWLRLATLAIPHDTGDQVIWGGVAHNVHARGVLGYTVRGLDSSYQPRKDGTALLRFRAVAPPGDVLERFVRDGETYWDAPLVNQPPGFFAILLASHAVLGKGDDGFPLLAIDPALRMQRGYDFMERTRGGFEARVAQIESSTLTRDEKDRARADLEARTFEQQVAWQSQFAGRCARAGAVREQLWATVPLLLAELVTVGLVFALARRLGASTLAALAAAVAYATDPIALYCAHRLLSNAPLAAACVATLLAEERLAEKRRGSVVVGLLAGFAISIKVSAVFLVPALVVGRVLAKRTDRSLAVLLGVTLLVAVPWWLLQWKLLGHPFGFAWRQKENWLAASRWGQLVAHRGAGYYVQSLARSPLVLLGVGWATLVLVHFRHAPRMVASATFSLLVIAASLVFEHKEARHLLLAYPALLALAAQALEKVGRRLPRPLLLIVGAAIAGALVHQANVGHALALDLARAP